MSTHPQDRPDHRHLLRHRPGRRRGRRPGRLAGRRHHARHRQGRRRCSRRAAKAGVADRVQVKRLDVIDAGSVAACVDEVVAEHGRLDAVVNNAGAGRVGTIEQGDAWTTSAPPWRSTSSASCEVTRAAMPHLRARGGRVLTVTSVGGVVGQPFNEAYCAAKFAVEGFMEASRRSPRPSASSVTVDRTGRRGQRVRRQRGLDVPACSPPPARTPRPCRRTSTAPSKSFAAAPRPPRRPPPRSSRR